MRLVAHVWQKYQNSEEDMEESDLDWNDKDFDEEAIAVYQRREELYEQAGNLCSRMYR